VKDAQIQFSGDNASRVALFAYRLRLGRTQVDKKQPTGGINLHCARAIFAPAPERPRGQSLTDRGEVGKRKPPTGSPLGAEQPAFGTSLGAIALTFAYNISLIGLLIACLWPTRPQDNRYGPAPL
jgi:hypothetical protein